MYSEIIGWHFTNPTHNGVIENPDFSLSNTDSVCGDHVQITLLLDANRKISVARFQGWGCATSIAMANIFCTWLEAKSLDEVITASPESLSHLFGELQPEQSHCLDILGNLIEQVNVQLKEAHYER